jgi:hypothetical protein
MPYKDADKRREAGRKSARKHREKRIAYYKEYISSPDNRAKKKSYMDEYESQPEVIEAKRLRAKESYQKNREKVLARSLKRRTEGLAFMNKVASHYGCQNPDCSWAGELNPYQIDFHHFDPSTKMKEVAKMCSYSFSKIIDEINKCVCLCKNCHAEAHRGDLKLDESMICKVNEDLEVICD